MLHPELSKQSKHTATQYTHVKQIPWLCITLPNLEKLDSGPILASVDK